jgi:hypothetical protein
MAKNPMTIQSPEAPYLGDALAAQVQPSLDEDIHRFHELDEHLKAYDRRWPNPAPVTDDHWAPALGGDVGVHE